MTKRTLSSVTPRLPLTGLEHEVMQAVWNIGQATVEAVYDVVVQKRRLKETTVRTILRRLEQKGYLRHEEKGRSYVYLAAEPARSLAARVARQIIDKLCRGSIEELVTGMVEAKVLSKAELDRLEKIVRAEKGSSRARK